MILESCCTFSSFFSLTSHLSVCVNLSATKPDFWFFCLRLQAAEILQWIPGRAAAAGRPAVLLLGPDLRSGRSLAVQPDT